MPVKNYAKLSNQYRVSSLLEKKTVNINYYPKVVKDYH